MAKGGKQKTPSTSEEWLKTRSDDELLHEAIMGSGAAGVPPEMMRRLRIALEKADASTTRANQLMVRLMIVGIVLAVVQVLAAGIQVYSMFQTAPR